MTESVDHVLLTRFNLPSAGAESFIRAREHWLRQRVELFERYCLPSVRAQTVPVHWLIYLDPESPQWLKERMAEHARSSVFTPVYRESVSREELVADLRSIVAVPGPLLVTTNLDNDDGLARDFAERVQQAAADEGRRAIYVDEGLILGARWVYLRRDPHNAFCSVSEPWESAVTCWSGWHTELERSMPTVHVHGGPGWLQVVHGDNVSNRVRGRVVSPSPYRARFPQLLADVSDPSVGEVTAERLVRAPARALREVARAAIKHLLLSVGGRRALETSRAAWARVHP